jgi:hypothetical protein
MSLLRSVLWSQMEASLRMMQECIEKCPADHWSGEPPRTIAKYPFWMVTYHTLCFVDVYLSPGDEVWQPRPDLHPLGRAELENEYPSRMFSRAELLAYAAICRELAGRVLGDHEHAESDQTLAGPSGFKRLPFSRAELHIYNIRHIQHHTGQLSAYLRRNGVDTRWVGRGRS